MAENDLNYYIGAIGSMFQEVEDLAGVAGWSVLMDVDQIPTKGLDWLAQFVGVEINHDDTDEGMRQQVRGHDRWGRGTPLSIIGPAYHWIPSGAALYMSERAPNPWHVTFIMVSQPGDNQTYEDLYDIFLTYHKVRLEYASYNALYVDQKGDWSKVQEVLNANKPAGVQYTFLDTFNTLYIAIYILEEDYQEVYDDWLTYQLLYDEPFPNITLDIPTFQQLVSTRYYRNIYNQYQTYDNVWDTYKLY